MDEKTLIGLGKAVQTALTSAGLDSSLWALVALGDGGISVIVPEQTMEDTSAVKDLLTRAAVGSYMDSISGEMIGEDNENYIY